MPRPVGPDAAPDVGGAKPGAVVDSSDGNDYRSLMAWAGVVWHQWHGVRIHCGALFRLQSPYTTRTSAPAPFSGRSCCENTHTGIC